MQGPSEDRVHKFQPSKLAMTSQALLVKKSINYLQIEQATHF